MADRPNGLDRAACATQLEQVLDQGAVLARQLTSGFGRIAVGQRLDLHPEGAADVGLAAAETGTVQSLEDRDLGARGQLPGLDTWATVPIPENRPPTRGTSRIR